MDALTRRLLDIVTYRRLAFLLSAMPLGLVWFVALVTVWSLCVGLVVTPLVIPVAIGLALMTRGFAAVEAELARSLLEVPAAAPAPPPGGGRFWARMRAQFGLGFWRAQGYLMLRWFLGFPVAIIFLSLLASAVGTIFAPVWVPFLHGGAHLGFWRPHTFLQCLAIVPLGLILLPATLLMVNPVARMFGLIASAMLPPGTHPRPFPSSQQVGWPAGESPGVGSRPSRVPPRRALRAHALFDGSLLLVLVLIWAVSPGGYFWPVWVALPLGLVLGIHAWFVLMDEQDLALRVHGNAALTGSVGVTGAISLFLICVWAISGHGYFWPIWPMLGLAMVLAAIAAAGMLGTPGRTELTERIETLESSRAGAVDLQDSELRRIERDLHDGAQARLVALGMSLGMAEQKLSSEPERVGELLAEARAGAEHALRELRDLARGIHPPVLADRGLEAALASLVSSTPMPVELTVNLHRRPAPAVETAAYFVAAEALTNAAKHAGAGRVQIRIEERTECLLVTVHDDGRGGADSEGNGLRGMRSRVEALDGTLALSSPPGGPTTIRAELPCES